MKGIQDKMDAYQIRLEAVQDKTETNQARTEANHEEVMAKLDVHSEKMMASLGKREATDLEANPEEKESEAEHWEVPKEHAAMETGRAPNKWHRDRHLAEKCCQESKEWTRGNCGSQKKLDATLRGTTRHTGVAPRKGHIIRKNQTRNNVTRGVLRGRTFGKKHQMNLEGSTGIKDPDTTAAAS
jgi:hypothetical protein